MNMFRMILVIAIAYACFALGAISPNATVDKWVESAKKPDRFFSTIIALISSAISQESERVPVRDRLAKARSHLPQQDSDAAGASSCNADRTRAQEIFDNLNALRAESGLSALTWNEDAYAPALSRAMDMVNRKYFSHYDPESGEYLAPGWGETLIGGEHNNFARVWRDSPPHWTVISQASSGAVAILRCRSALNMRVMKIARQVDEIYPMAIITVGLWQ